MKLPDQIRAVLQALLISAVMLAPVWGQIHKTVHGIKATAVSEQSLFSDHQEGSLVCQALDHLASDEGPQSAALKLQFEQPEALFISGQFAQRNVALTLAFSARAPPTSL